MDKKDVQQKKICESLKNVRLSFLQGIDVSKLLFNECYYAINNSWMKSLKFVVERILFFFGSFSLERKNDDIMLFSPIYHRKEYDDYWMKIQEILKEYTRLSVDFRFHKLLSISSMFSNLVLFFKVRKQFRCINEKNQRNYLSARIVELNSFIKYIELCDINPKVAICFFDGDMYSNYLLQRYKRFGTVTATCQHGQPLFRSFDEDRLNQSQILNLTADYYLAKGSFTKKQFAKANIPTNKIVVIGSLLNEDNIIVDNNIHNSFGVFLDCPLLPFANNTNKRLIELAEKIYEIHNIPYFVKLHPLDLESNYNYTVLKGCLGIIVRQMSVVEISKKIDFAIICASAVYVDLITLGIRSYKLEYGPKYPIVNDQEDIVQDFDEIIDRNNKWLCLTNEEKVKCLRKKREAYYITDSDGQALKKFVNKLIN